MNVLDAPRASTGARLIALRVSQARIVPTVASPPGWRFRGRGQRPGRWADSNAQPLDSRA